ncbi:hypothetical protein C0J52_10778 [Blattella germanica]|nr:hypothetical protein C0J52_10778 [Blattella germanica]
MPKGHLDIEGPTAGARAPSKFRLRLPQILANVAANLLILDLCMALAFTTVIIAATFKNPKEELSINENQASWLGSIAFICQPIGSVVSGLIVEWFGRRWSMVLVNFPFLLGWLLYSFATSVEMLFAANIVLGVGIGFMEAPIMTYLGETCQPDIRALITAFPGITCQVSYFVVFLMGNVTHWRTAAGINAALPIFTVLYVLLMPETPIWLLSRGRYKDAEKALCWLRGWVSPEFVKDEFNQLLIYSNSVNKTNYPVTTISTLDKGYDNQAFEVDGSVNKDNHTGNNATEAEVDEDGGAHCSLERWKEVVRPATRRPLGVVLPCFFLLHWGGLSSIRPYLVGSGVISVAGGTCLFVFVHWAGKRRLSLVAMGGSAVSTLVIAVYSYIVMRPGGSPDSAMPWLPLTMVIALSFFNSLFFYVPWNLMCEVFPFRTRGIASGFSAAMCYIFLFAASKTYLDMENAMQMYGAFFLFTAINVAGIILVYWKVPVTEGKSLVEIEEYFSK